MKSTAQKTTRATRPASHASASASRRHPLTDAAASTLSVPWVSLAPREADSPDIERNDVEVTVSTTTTLSDTLSESPTREGDTRWLTWTGTVVREMESVSDDPEDGVAVRLSARMSTVEKSAGKKDLFEEDTISFGRIGNLTVPEFRRMLAALNALAAALPSTPEVALLRGGTAPTDRGR